MKKTVFSPQGAAAAVIFTVLMFVTILTKAQSTEYQVANPKVSQDTWHYEKPCPPCPTFPVTKQESPKRLPGTNGAYVECNPTIIVNPAQCTGNNNCGMQNQNYMPVQNDGFRTWDMIVAFLLGGIILFIVGLLYKMSNNNRNYQEIHHHNEKITNIYHYGTKPGSEHQGH